MKTEKKFCEIKTKSLHKQETFLSIHRRKTFWLLSISLVALFLLNVVSIGTWAKNNSLNQGNLTSVTENASTSNKSSPSATPPKEVSTEYFKEQYDKARGSRNSPIGTSAKVVVPKELKSGVRKQANKILQMKKNGYNAPMDYADLAQRIADGKLVELPLATETYVVEVGGSATRKPFTTFNFDDEINSPTIKSNSKDYKILSNFIEKNSSKKLSLENPNDRREIKRRLLRTLHPKAEELFLSISSEYKQKFNRPLRITSMTRSIEYQVGLNKINANSYRVRGKGSLPPHTSGYAFDIPYIFMDAKEQQFIINKMAELDKKGEIDALREGGINRTFHIFYIGDNNSSSTDKNHMQTADNKSYMQMTFSEKKQFIASKSNDILSRFGRVNGDKISPKGLQEIKRFIDGYVRRIKSNRINSCMQNGWLKSDLKSILERGTRTAPYIKKAFAEKGIDPQIGIYIAMIESEYCSCLQSPVGSLGMFQLTRTTGKLHGLETHRGASPVNPDERCSPAKASKAAASFIDSMYIQTQKRLGEEYGKNALGTPLIIAAFNSGQGSLRKNVRIVKELNGNKNVSFWKLMENKEKLSRQFQSENVKYIPKFFAASIIGENPKAFGIKGVTPLSKVN